MEGRHHDIYSMCTCSGYTSSEATFALQVILSPNA